MTIQTYEAQASELRRVINFQSKMTRTEKEVAARRQQADKEDAERRAARREFDARRNKILSAFLLRNFWSMILASVICLLDIFGLVELWLCMTVLGIAFVVLVVNFWAFISQSARVEKSFA